MIEGKDFFILRTPLMPVSEVTTELFQTSALAREALYLASKTSLNDFDKAGCASESLNLTLIKYLKRMTTRCTPFGLFAGISVGHFSENTEIEPVLIFYL